MRIIRELSAAPVVNGDHLDYHRLNCSSWNCPILGRVTQLRVNLGGWEIVVGIW